MSLTRRLMEGKAERAAVRRALVEEATPVRSRRSQPAPPSDEQREDERMSNFYTGRKDFVTSVVRALDSTGEISRETSERVHVSSMIGDGWCTRRAVLARRHGIEVTRYAGAQHRIVWAMGRAAEQHLRNTFIRGHGRDRVIGEWRCLCGETRIRGAGLTDAAALSNRCGTCNDPPVHYGELTSFGREGAVTGSPDLLFQLLETGSRVHVVEIKSMNKMEFTGLSAPKGEHVLQACSYAHLLSEDGHEVATVRVIYVCKDFLGPKLHPFKEFTVASVYDHETAFHPPSKMLIDAAQEAARWLAMPAPSLPPKHGACSSPGSTKAKSCAACSLCFQIE